MGRLCLGGSGSVGRGEGDSFPTYCACINHEEQSDGDEKYLLLMLVTWLAGSLEENLLERAHPSESASVSPPLSVADIISTGKSWYMFNALFVAQGGMLLGNTIRGRGKVSKCV
jgi:hypothetical protein